jgi:hypothetical protein
MMKFLFTGIVLSQAFNCFAQTRADYENAVKKVGKFYNLKQADSLLSMYSDNANKSKISIWSGKEIDELKIRNGKMISYDYVGEDNGITLFKAEFARSTHMMGLLLGRDDKLLVFQFKMSSPHIDSLLEEK